MPVSCHFRGCKAPLFRIVSGAISSELPLPFTFTFWAIKFLPHRDQLINNIMYAVKIPHAVAGDVPSGIFSNDTLNSTACRKYRKRSDLGRRVAGSRDEGPHVRRQGQTHNVAGVTVEGRRLLTGLDVPQSAAKINYTQNIQWRIQAEDNPVPGFFKSNIYKKNGAS